MFDLLAVGTRALTIVDFVVAVRALVFLALRSWKNLLTRGVGQLWFDIKASLVPVLS
jgi:hypothetical protein